MKKLGLLVSSIVLTGALVACHINPEHSVITMEAGEKSVAFRDELFSKYKNDTKTDEQALSEFETKWLPQLKSRTVQEFPKVKTKNKLEKEVYDNGDVYTLTGDDDDIIVFYIHGGAWVWEIASEHVDFCDKLVDALDAKVYMPIYPLAPQANYKEGYQMLEQVYDDLLKQDKPIIVMGDSAGGTLTLGLVLKLKKEGKRLPDKVVVLSPCADATFSNPEIKDYQKNDGYLSRVQSLESAKLWADGYNLNLPQLSPLSGNFKDFPETLMFVATRDILIKDELKLYEKMIKSGVDVTLVKGEGFWHVYPAEEIEEQGQCLDIIADFVK